MTSEIKTNPTVRIAAVISVTGFNIEIILWRLGWSGIIFVALVLVVK